MRISDWSSDVCSSDLHARGVAQRRAGREKRADVRQVVERASLAEHERKMLVARTRDTDRHHLLKQRAADRRALEMQQVGLDFQFVEYTLEVEAAQPRRLDPIRTGARRQTGRAHV